MDPSHFRDLGIALGLGFLIGLQRQWSKNRIGGIRTFPLIAVFGALCGLLGHDLENLWIVATGLIIVGTLFAVAYLRQTETDNDLGATTEMAGVLMFIIGAMVPLGYHAIAVVSTGVVAVLLHWKEPLHRTVERIGADDFRAIVRLVLIGMVILPVLPDESYGPFHVLNPFRIWLIVVLIVGISMAAYIVQRFLGERVSTPLAGILGGFISSTATTVSYARRAKENSQLSDAAAVVIMIASTVVFARVLIEISVVAPTLLGRVAPPLVAMMILMAVISGVAYLRSRLTLQQPAHDGPPKDLAAAVIFGLLYAGVLIAVAAAKEYLGSSGLYIVAAISGLTDMDAITVSSAQFMKDGLIPVETGWRLILVGAIANLCFKAAVVAVLGSAALLRWIAVMFGLSVLGGAAILLLWPA